MTLFEYLSILGVVLGAGALVLNWANDTARGIDRAAVEEDIEELFTATADGFRAVDESIDELVNELNVERADVAAVLENHEESLNGAAADMVQTQQWIHLLQTLVKIHDDDKFHAARTPTRSDYQTASSSSDCLLKPFSYKIDDRRSPLDPYPLENGDDRS
jgi:hypothetical protein